MLYLVLYNLTIIEADGRGGRSGGGSGGGRDRMKNIRCHKYESSDLLSLKLF
jgi:hypothetical protein